MVHKTTTKTKALMNLYLENVCLVILINKNGVYLAVKTKLPHPEVTLSSKSKKKNYTMLETKMSRPVQSVVALSVQLGNFHSIFPESSDVITTPGP